MRLLAMLLTVSAAGSPAAALTGSDGSDLAIRFFNAIPDICFQTARGHPPTNETAGDLLLEPAVDIPPTVKAHFGKVTSWFRLRSQPENVFIGTGDGPTTCHVVLANTVRTAEVQNKVIGFLQAGGFQLIQNSASAAPLTDMLFVKATPDGYMLISLQAPRNTIRGGDGEQGAVHVSLMPKAMFESLLSKR